VLPIPSASDFLSIVPNELVRRRPIPENTDRIYFSTMMDDYGEVFAALEGRGRDVLSQL
jgi:hypothetical protein